MLLVNCNISSFSTCPLNFLFFLKYAPQTDFTLHVEFATNKDY